MRAGTCLNLLGFYSPLHMFDVCSICYAYANVTLHFLSRVGGKRTGHRKQDNLSSTSREPTTTWHINGRVLRGACFPR